MIDRKRIRIMWQAGFVTCLVLVVMHRPIWGQGYATVLVKQSASTLNGTVRAGVSGETLEKVSVAVCDMEFRQCSDVSITDSTGRFSIAPHKGQRVYYLKFMAYGMDPEEVVLTLKRGAGPLDIRMIVAT